MSTVSDLRTVAIIAHVDHGKTTLVDALFQQSGIYRDNQAVVERAMDSMDQERERGITIMAKCTSVQYDDTHIQIVDTPGHADFGGEVERTLRMVDGVVLLVDAAEGPMPQTRFVLRKAMELKLPMVIAVNKIDRADARALEVVEECYSLLIDLGGDEEDLECPILFTNGRAGTASNDLDVPGTDIRPLVDAIISGIPAANRRVEQPFTMQVNQLGYDDYVGTSSGWATLLRRDQDQHTGKSGRCKWDRAQRKNRKHLRLQRNPTLSPRLGSRWRHRRNRRRW